MYTVEPKEYPTGLYIELNTFKRITNIKATTKKEVIQYWENAKEIIVIWGRNRPKTASDRKGYRKLS